MQDIGTTVIQAHGQIEVERIAVSEDNWAYGELVLNSDMTREHGQERIVGIDTLHVHDGKIIFFAFVPNILHKPTFNYYASLGLYSPAAPPA